MCGEAQNHGTVEIVVVDGAVAGTIFNFFFFLDRNNFKKKNICKEYGCYEVQILVSL